MLKALQPENEKERLEALRSYQVLDTPPDKDLDDLTALAAAICGTPIALVSLVDAHRQWFKSKVGLEANETSRDLSFCAHGILGKDLLVVSDTQVDKRFADNPLVTSDPHIRFYAGIPLITADGFGLGSLCVIDRVPRTLSPEQTQALRILGRQVVTHLELRKSQAALRELNQYLGKRVEERTSAVLSVNTVLKQEIEERKRMEDRLRSSEAKYRQLFAAETDALIVVDVETRKCVEINEAAQKLYGYNREEFLRLQVTDISAEPEKTEALFQNLRLDELGQVSERSHKKKDGTVFLVEIHFGTILLENRKVLLSSVRDITERKRLEAAMIQSEKMAGIGQFSAGVAHDVNNPIAVILGFSQTLLSRLPESDPMIMPLKSIEHEALRCKTLVQNLLAFSRGQGGGKPVLKPEDVNQVLEGAFVLVATLARSKKVELVRPVRLEIPPISIDSNQIQQVVINLCTNAIDAMPDGGQLTIGLANQGDHIEVSVQDTGTGIPPEVRDRMFEAFFTTKEVGKGTGLGLSIISTIIKAHQGTIDVQSEVGKGTIFTIHLPLAQPVASFSDARSMAA